MKKRLLPILILLFAAFALSGCGASITVSEFYINGEYYNDIELRAPSELVQTLNDSAVTVNNKKWTFPAYVSALMTGSDTNFDYTEITAEIQDSGDYVFVYRKRFLSRETADLALMSGTIVKTVSTQSTNGFIKSISTTSPNPFNNLRKNYDDIVNPNASTTRLQILKNGVKVRQVNTNEFVTLFPSFTEAFPAAKNYELDSLMLSVLQYVNSNRRASSGEMVSSDSQGAVYKFTRPFDTYDRTVDYDYTRIDALGWSLMSLLIGGIVILVIALITHKKPPKETLPDRFPYNPETFKDIDINLPTKI